MKMKLIVIVLIVVIGLMIPCAGCSQQSSIEKKFVGTWTGYDLSVPPWTDYVLLSDIGGSAKIKINSDGTGYLSYDFGSIGTGKWEYDFYLEPGKSGNTYVAFDVETDEYLGSIGHTKDGFGGTTEVLTLTDPSAMVTFLSS